MTHQVDPIIQNTLIASTQTANMLNVGDIINGPGIPNNSTILEISYVGSGTWEIIIDSNFIAGDVYTALGNHIPYLDPNNPVNNQGAGMVQWPTEIFVTPSNPLPVKTLTYKEDVKGWVSFKSFTPENAISMANDYYTFNNGELWKHHDENVNRNTFYGTYTNSTFNVILNQAPGSVKSFNTLNYEGSQSKVTINVQDDQYYNLASKQGWYVDNMFTNKETGSIEEFIEKEGKWFNYIKGNQVSHDSNGVNILVNQDGSSSWDQASFAIQGLGTFVDASGYSFPGCMDINSFTFNINANVDDGSCKYAGCMDVNASNYGMLETVSIHIDNYTWQDQNGVIYNPTITDLSLPCANCCNAVIFGCTDPTALNYDPIATNDDGSCVAIVLGCTDPLAINYDITANVDDGSCTYCVYGCTDATQFNYDPLATCDDGSCTAIVSGCTDPTANNENTLANTDDGSCMYDVFGCDDPTANNYYWDLNTDPGNQDLIDDGSCTYDVLGCTNLAANNYDATATVDDGSCTYDPQGCTDPTACNYDAVAIIDDSSCILPDGCTDPTANNYDPAYLCDDGSCEFDGCTDQMAFNWSGANFTDDGSCQYLGCTDPAADNYGWTAPGVTPTNGQVWTVTGSGQSFTSPNGITGVSADASFFAPNSTAVCQYPAVGGCTDSTQDNYDQSATFDDGSCCMYGCTDPNSCNYDPNATCLSTCGINFSLVHLQNTDPNSSMPSADWDGDGTNDPNSNGNIHFVALIDPGSSYTVTLTAVSGGGGFTAGELVPVNGPGTATTISFIGQANVNPGMGVYYKNYYAIPGGPTHSGFEYRLDITDNTNGCAATYTYFVQESNPNASPPVDLTYSSQPHPVNDPTNSILINGQLGPGYVANNNTGYLDHITGS